MNRVFGFIFGVGCVVGCVVDYVFRVVSRLPVVFSGSSFFRVAGLGQGSDTGVPRLFSGFRCLLPVGTLVSDPCPSDSLLEIISRIFIPLSQHIGA